MSPEPVLPADAAAAQYTAKVFNGFVYRFDQDGNVLRNERGIIRRWPYECPWLPFSDPWKKRF